MNKMIFKNEFENLCKKNNVDKKEKEILWKILLRHYEIWEKRNGEDFRLERFASYMVSALKTFYEVMETA